METNWTRSTVKVAEIDKLLAPPGFVSRTAFVLKKVASTEDSAPLKTASDLTPSSSHGYSSLEDHITEANLQIKHRAWILHDQLDHHEEESDDEPSLEEPEETSVRSLLGTEKRQNTEVVQEDCLPKGLIWGCSACSTCLKVPAQWDPEGACSVSLEEAPVFQPTDEEFRDTLKYIESISEQVKPYGFCRIVPPPSWQPPCLGETNTCKSYNFTTEMQMVNEFRNSSKRKRLASRNVEESKRQKISNLDLHTESGNGDTVKFDTVESLQVSNFQFQYGPHFTLESFKNKADHFKEFYFSKTSKTIYPEISPATCHEQWEPSEEDIEGEYWRILEKPTAEIEVLRGANLDAESFRSRYLESCKTDASDFIGYQESGWNLSNLSRLPGSLLSFEKSDCLGDLAPQFHIGMCFSTLSWEVEKHHLYSLYYLHFGAPKIWYAVPGQYFHKLQAAVKKHFPGIFVQRPELFHKLAMQISPATLQANGIPVYRCIQRPKEFVLFLPEAYHTGFDCGFNVSESVCCAPLAWLPHGQRVTVLYREMKMKPLVSHEKLLLRVANEAIKARWEFLLKSNKSPATMTWKDAVGKVGVTAETLKVLVKSEARQREFLCNNTESRKMDKFFDKGPEKDCCICKFILYLSASFCQCNPNRYACLKHTKHLCTCAWSQKVFLFRLKISELELLVEAMQGKFSAINRWIKENLGKALEYDTADSSVQVIPTDDSSMSKTLLECKGETSCSSVDGTNAKDATRKMVAESVARILKSTSFGASRSKLLDAWTSSITQNDASDDTSSESDDEKFFSQFRVKEDKPLFPSHSASNGQTVSNGQAMVSSKLTPDETQEKSSGKLETIVILSSSDDED